MAYSRRLFYFQKCQQLLLLFLIILIFVFGASRQEDDLYYILGVTKTATVQDIKRAYRRKALATHPDKRSDLPPEQAAEEFHQLVHAFEILSDPNARRRYDRASSSSSNSNKRGEPIIVREHYAGESEESFWESVRRSHFQYHQNQHHQHHHRQRQYMKNRMDVRLAQSRVMHIFSLQQLQTVMVDVDASISSNEAAEGGDDDNNNNDNGDNGQQFLERNLLLCFVTPGQVEQIADDELLFPYPFAQLSAQGIWWEDLLQTGKIRYHKSNEITTFFNLPTGDEMRASQQPILLFGRRGLPLWEASSFVRLQTADRTEFQQWVWQQIRIFVTFTNQHFHPVEAFWYHGGQWKYYFTLQPGESSSQNSMLSHEWWFRDARVDTFPGAPPTNNHRYQEKRLAPETMVGIYKMTNDTTPQNIYIQPKSCLDLSNQCLPWKQKGQCNRNQDFMKQYCRLSCRFCSEKDDAINIREIQKAHEEQTKWRQEQEQQHRRQQQQQRWGQEF